MVKLTIVGRVRDGLHLAQGPRFLDVENGDVPFYNQQAEFIITETSRGDLAASKMTILVDHQCFNYMVENGIFFITLCDASYPRKLAFHFLHDLQKEFEKFDKSLIDKITKPYSFLKFESIIGRLIKQYIDTRTQANLSKLNSNRKQDLDIVVKHITEIIARRRSSEISEKASSNQRTHSIWCSPCLEVIALKWTPIMTIIMVAGVLLWASLVSRATF